MEAAVALEGPAVEVRERLAGFVEEVAVRLPLRRQRENALLYVRGLIEHGGRKSLQPTLFRLEETPARYESVQQFLADSPWGPELLVRAPRARAATSRPPPRSHGAFGTPASRDSFNLCGAGGAC